MRRVGERPGRGLMRVPSVVPLERRPSSARNQVPASHPYPLRLRKKMRIAVRLQRLIVLYLITLGVNLIGLELLIPYAEWLDALVVRGRPGSVGRPRLRP